MMPFVQLLSFLIFCKICNMYYKSVRQSKFRNMNDDVNAITWGRRSKYTLFTIPLGFFCLMKGSLRVSLEIYIYIFWAFL